MKIKDVRSLSTELLEEKLYTLQEQLFNNFRCKKAVGQVIHYKQMRNIRKDIARVNTVLKEREIEQKKAKK